MVAQQILRAAGGSLALTHALGFETGSQEEHEQKYEKELKITAQEFVLLPKESHSALAFQIPSWSAEPRRLAPALSSFANLAGAECLLAQRAAPLLSA